MAATLLLVGVGSTAVAATGVDVDAGSIAIDEVVGGGQEQLRLRDRDERCEPIGDQEAYRHTSTKRSPTTVAPDRDEDQVRDLDRDRTRDQLRDGCCEPDGDGQRDRDRDRDGTGVTGDPAGGTLAPVGEQVRTQTGAQVQTQAVTPEQTQEQAQVREEAQTRVQEESQHHSREQAGAPDARGQH